MLFILWPFQTGVWFGWLSTGTAHTKASNFFEQFVYLREQTISNKHWKTRENHTTILVSFTVEVEL